MGEKELERLEAELDVLMPRIARKGETRAKLFERLSTDSPEPDKLLDEYRVLNRHVEGWLRQAAFVTVPWDKLQLSIVQTPPERRGNMHDQDAVDASNGKASRTPSRAGCAQVGEPLAARAFVQEAHHVRFEIRRYHLASRNRAREAYREVPSAGADVSDDHRWLQFQRSQHIVGALPLVARRIVEKRSSTRPRPRTHGAPRRPREERRPPLHGRDAPSRTCAHPC